jgi:hypothetical protein
MRLSVFLMVAFVSLGCSKDEPKDEAKTEDKNKDKDKTKTKDNVGSTAAQGAKTDEPAAEGRGDPDGTVAATKSPGARATDDELDLVSEALDRVTAPGIRVDVTTKAIWVSGKEVVPITCKLDGEPCKDDKDRLKNNARFSVDAVYREGGRASGLIIIPLQLVLKAEIQRYSKDAADENQSRKVRSKSRMATNTAFINTEASIPFRLVADIVYTIGKVNIYDLRFFVDGIPLKATLKPDAPDNKG